MRGTAVRCDVLGIAYEDSAAVHRALAKLEPVVAEHMFVGRYLKGAQTTSERDAATALAALGKGASVALITRPITIEQIAHVDELNQRLPAHSTAIHPAIAQGVVQYAINPDEDVQ